MLLILVILSACDYNDTKDQKVFIGFDSSDVKVSYKDTNKVVVKGDSIVCINYEDAKSWEDLAEKYNYDFKLYSHKSKRYLINKKRLTFKQTKQTLFGDKDSVDINNIWSDELVLKENVKQHFENNEFYLIDTVATRSDWQVVLIEKLETNGSQTFVLTVDKNHKLISKILAGFYFRSGTKMGNDGSRFPWFAKKEACIDGSLKIKTDDNQGVIKTYSIDKRGIIKEEK
jgi:hypothetical protein